MALRPRQPRLSRRPDGKRRQPGHLPRDAGGDSGGQRASSPLAGRYHRRRQRGRDQRRVPLSSDFDRPVARTADRPVARFGRCRSPDRSRRGAFIAICQSLGAADRLDGGEAQRRRHRRAGGSHGARGSEGQAVAFRALALVRTAIRRRALHRAAARCGGSDGGSAARAAIAARRPAARSLRHRHRFSRASRAATPQFAARSGGDRAPAGVSLFGSRRAAAGAGPPRRVGVRRPGDIELSRRVSAVHGRRAGRRAGGAQDRVAQPRRFPGPGAAATGRRECRRQGRADRWIGARQRPVQARHRCVEGTPGAPPDRSPLHLHRSLAGAEDPFRRGDQGSAGVFPDDHRRGIRIAAPAADPRQSGGYRQAIRGDRADAIDHRRYPA